MTELTHSVLFTGDDGLPILFNIQNTTEKESLKALIERNGGLCSLSEEAIILVSPGTKVLSILANNKNLISSRYVFDCVKEECLLDTDEYKIEINEVEASDFSDSSNLQVNSLGLESNKQLPDDLIDNSIDIIQPVKDLSPQNIICSYSNHDFDFQDNEKPDTVVEVLKNVQQSNNHLEVTLESSENHIHFGVDMNKAIESKGCANAMPDSLENCGQSIIPKQKKSVGEHFCIVENRAASDVEDPIVAVVSSSQENPGALDQFDNMILNKAQEKPVLDEDCLSQSYTVSSSADAQISPTNQQHSHNTSAEIFNGSSAAPDSASQTTERQQYINNLEAEIENILKKPSPKSIQDKIVLVKYICTVKKLDPAIVLQTLQRF